MMLLRTTTTTTTTSASAAAALSMPSMPYGRRRCTCSYTFTTRSKSKTRLLSKALRTNTSTRTRTRTCVAGAGVRGHGQGGVVLAAEVTDLEDLELETMERMDKALEKLSENLVTIRTGRATPALLDGIQVDYYGAPTPIKSLASITVQDGATVVVQPFDKSALSEIEKAIRESELGLSPTNDGSIVRINVPQLTAERRKEMVKVVSKFGEESKVAIRNIRRDAKKSIDKYQKDGLSEDLCKDKEGDLQKLTDDYVKKVDDTVKSKEKEITQV
mmetsp:Transcript_371/g.708  ORF Transcript_371/g.708 Transcript_371/m.708 type:complete len:273 (+) Transcript_371:82-900(+)